MRPTKSSPIFDILVARDRSACLLTSPLRFTEAGLAIRSGRRDFSEVVTFSSKEVEPTRCVISPVVWFSRSPRGITSCGRRRKTNADKQVPEAAEGRDQSAQRRREGAGGSSRRGGRFSGCRRASAPRIPAASPRALRRVRYFRSRVLTLLDWLNTNSSPRVEMSQ